MVVILFLSLSSGKCFLRYSSSGVWFVGGVERGRRRIWSTEYVVDSDMMIMIAATLLIEDSDCKSKS